MGLDALIEAQPWFALSWTDFNDLAPHAPRGMLGQRESLLCYYLARDAFQGSGVIVDAGSFLGRSAFFFAHGLRSNPHYAAPGHRIHCFDNFLVNERLTTQYIATHFGQTLGIGESTRALFDSQVAPVQEMLEIHAGDFHTVSWRPRPIEILFVDIAKSVSLCKRVAEVFFSSLIPGQSLVMHQDYHHPWLPHIHVMMEHLAEYFELAVPRVDDSAVFRCRAPIPAAALERAIRYDFSHDEQMALMDGAIARLPEQDRYYVRLARVVLQLGKASDAALRGELDELERQFQEQDRGYTGNPYFEDVRSAIDEMEGWRCHAEENYTRALEIADRLLPKRTTTYLMTMRGQALLALGRVAEAEQQLRAAVETRPPSSYAYIALARTLMAQNRFVEAEEQLLRGLRDPQAHGASEQEFLETLAVVWSRENAPQRNTATMDMLRAEFPQNPEVWVLDARLRRLTGNSESAQQSLRKASQLGLSAERLDEIRQELELPL